MINDSYDLVIGIYLGIIFFILAYKFLPNSEMIMEDNILNLIFISFFITIFFLFGFLFKNILSIQVNYISIRYYEIRNHNIYFSDSHFHNILHISTCLQTQTNIRLYYHRWDWSHFGWNIFWHYEGFHYESEK